MSKEHLETSCLHNCNKTASKNPPAMLHIVEVKEMREIYLNFISHEYSTM